MIDLYHFTCRDRANLIEDEPQPFILLPNEQVFVKGRLIWFTDLDEIDYDALGLQGPTLKCDRGEVLYHVTECLTEPVPWIGSIWQARTAPHDQIELHRGREPRRWWVTDEIVRVERVE